MAAAPVPDPAANPSLPTALVLSTGIEGVPEGPWGWPKKGGAAAPSVREETEDAATGNPLGAVIDRSGGSDQVELEGCTAAVEAGT